jgi:putative transposase
MQRHDKLWYHAIWATKHHQQILDTAHFKRIPVICAQRAEEWHFQIMSVGGYRDHIHMLLSIPPDRPVAKVVGWIKGAVSHAFGEAFAWQSGYCIYTVSPGDLSVLHDYIERQEELHAQGLVQAQWEMPHLPGSP